MTAKILQMKSLRAYVELSLAMGIVGSSVVVGKMIAASFPVFLAGALRFAVAALILLPWLYAREGRLVARITRKDWGILFLQAFCGVFLFSVFLLYGLRLTSAAEGGIITSTTPAALGVISAIWLKERADRRTWLGIAFTVCGIMFVNVFGASPHAARGSLPLAGNLLIFGAVIGEALFSIFGKMLSKGVSPLANATWMGVFGLLLFLPLGAREAAQFDFTAVTAAQWLAIVYLGVVVTVMAFWLWFVGLAKVQANTAAVFTGVIPLSALACSALLLHERLSWAHVAGCACVLGGIALIARPSRPQARPAVAPIGECAAE